MRRFLGLAVVASAMAAAAACGGARGPMQRALDPSMEGVLRSASYLRGVAGITGDGSRLMRSDGYVYLADVAPQLRYLAVTGDSLTYRRLRRYTETRLVHRDGSGIVPRSRSREGTATVEVASPYGAMRLSDALAAGWQAFGDTASAVLAAGLSPVAPSGPALTAADRLVEQCATAEATRASNPAAARRVLGEARGFHGMGLAGPESALGMRGIDGELVALACLIRVAVAVQDPDATVRFLDRLQDHLANFQLAGGRPDPGAAADVLLALRAVQAVGPGYYEVRKQ